MVCSQTCVPCRAVPGWCTRPGRERGGTSALVNIPLQPHDVGALGVGHGRTDFPGDRQTYRDVLRTEAVRAALLVAQKRFPVPLSLSLRYIDRLAGNNNRLRTRSLGFILAGSF